MNNQTVFDQMIAQIPAIPIVDFAIFHHTVWIQIDQNSAGIASTLVDKSREIPEDVGLLHTKNLNELAQRIKSPYRVERSIGLAAINAYYNQFSKLSDHSTENAFSIAERLGVDKNVTIVGAFPSAFKLREKNICKSVSILEKGANVIPGTISSDDADEIFEKSDIVVVSATSIINNTIDELVTKIKHSTNILVGPTAPLNASLFDLGFTYLCGTIVSDCEIAYRHLSQGASYRNMPGIQFVTRKA